jgi:hypothetical protein
MTCITVTMVAAYTRESDGCRSEDNVRDGVVDCEDGRDEAFQEEKPEM